MKPSLPSPVRDLAALVVALAACPLAVFGGANIGCVGKTGLEGECALTMVFVSPLVLVGAGALAGMLTRGWTGLLATLAGVVGGMLSILAISNLAGRPVPPDPIAGLVATVWFMAPVILGYAAVRGLARLRAARGR